MPAADPPFNEEERLEALASYQVLDSLPEEDYDNITLIASTICKTPISLITLIDDKRQWFKSKRGIDLQETPRTQSFCAHGLLTPNLPLIVRNTREDRRFRNNPLVTGEPHIQFYAGIPLVNPDGYALGSLCVIDHQPKDLDDEQLEILQALAKQVVKLLELRKTVHSLEAVQRDLKKSNNNLKEFAYIIAHDIKAPLRQIGQLSDAILDDYEDQLDSKGNDYLKLLKEAAKNAHEFVRQVLNYSKKTYFQQFKKDQVNLRELISDIVQQLNPPKHIQIHLSENLPSILTSRIALHQIISNLISNAIKYQDKEEGWVRLNFLEEKDYYLFEVEDNGIGIPADRVKSIFSLFYRAHQHNLRNKDSSGVGLSIVRKLVENLGGTIEVESKVGEGSNFKFSLAK